MHANATPLESSGDSESALASCVPICYQGLWRRRLLEQNGQIDRDTTVYWLQIGRVYADIRVPADRPVCENLESTSVQTLQALARQQGFAGYLDVESNVLSWHRWLDYQPPAPVADIGRVHFERDVLVEHGVLADYREDWVLTEPPSADRIGLVLESEEDEYGHLSQRRGVLIAMGSVFMIAIAREHPLQIPKATNHTGVVTLEQLVAEASTDTERSALLNCSIDFGQRLGHDWPITLSTLPPHEGKSFQGVHGRWTKSGVNHYIQQLETNHRSVIRYWRVVERGATFSQLNEPRCT